MNKRTIFLIVGLCLWTYSNSLTNGFVGDDRFFFEGNKFYRSLKNLPRLLTKQAIVSHADLDQPHLGERDTSGVTSYRPVTLATFFTDSFLWKTRPFGFHLTNILFHLMNSLLVFYCSFLIIGRRHVSVMAALLFFTHPIHTEAVNVIGYRSDLVATFFYLLAFIVFIKYRVSQSFKGKIPLLLGSYFAFFLGLFAKESCSTLPFMILAYDFYFQNHETLKDRLSKRGFVYAVFFFILIFYWYIHFFVFRNINSGTIFNFANQNLISWPITLKIFYDHLIPFFWPSAITVVPPLYVPSLASIKIYEVACAIIFLFVCSYFIWKFFQKSKKASFFLLWFIVTYVPTSNMIPLLDPYGFRFMYLPSIGLFVLLASFLEKIITLLKKRIKSQNIGFILKAGMLVLYVPISFSQNTYYKNDFILAKEALRNYPDSTKAYEILGTEYFYRGEFSKALENYRKHLMLETRNPFYDRKDFRVHHWMGQCYVRNPDKAIEEFKIAISLKPDYVLPYLDIARAYIAMKDYKESLPYALKAVQYAHKAVQLKSDLAAGYFCVIYNYIQLGRRSQAQELLEKALKMAPGDPDLQFLRTMIQEK